MTSRLFLASFAVLLLSDLATGQMSGAYTIDPTGSGTRNFTSFTAAGTALKANGVSGPVVFTVATATITESWTIPVVTGTSTTNTITYKGIAIPPTIYLNKLVGDATSIITIEAGAHDVIIDGFDFVQTTAGHAVTGLAVRSTGNNRPISNIEITNCRFQNGIVGANGRGHIYVEGRGLSTNWSIHDCEFVMGSYNYGIYMSQIGRCLVKHNQFKLSGTLYGMYWINWNNSRNVICNNVFTGTTRSNSGACAIHVAASNINNHVCFNTIDITTPGSAIRTFGTSGNYNRIYGNVIAVKGAGVGIHVTIASLNRWLSDGNLFFIQSGNIGRIVNTNYRGLAAWRTATSTTPLGTQDRNSVEGNPRFRSATDLHLTASSPGLGKAILFAGRHDPVVDWDGWIRGSKQDTGAYELTAYKLYGSGCTGTGSKVPTFSIAGDIAPGGRVTITLGNARPNSTAVLSAGAPKALIPLGGNCNLLHTPLLIFFLQTNATGGATLQSTLPANLPINGQSAYMQFGVADPGAASGIALTPGGEIRI